MSATEKRPIVLHQVRDSAGGAIWFGEVQATWLVEHGHIVRAATLEDRHVYQALDPDDISELNAVVRSEPACRECDFCHRIPTHWNVPIRPFVVTEGPSETRPARVEGPIPACDVCVVYVRANEKQRLVEYSVASNIEYARGQGGYLTSVVLTNPRHRLEHAIRPMVREVVYGMFANRRGWPERAS